MKKKARTYCHLTYEQRNVIETMLYRKFNFSDIANSINKNVSTISREVKARRYIYDNQNRYRSARYTHCNKLNKAPFVCNGCEKRRHCRMIRFLYHAKNADLNYKNVLSSAREGIDLTDGERHNIDLLLKDLIANKKQSINHIFINNPDTLTMSKPTLYSYINSGVFSVRNIDLARKVKYKPRKKDKVVRKKIEAQVRAGRKYSDFLEYYSSNPNISIVEMDTVEGKKGSDEKVLLTLMFRKTKLMLVYLMDSKTIDSVIKVFDELKTKLGIDLFKKLFEVILTDNGSEFLDPLSIETDATTGEILSKVYYCDPNCSWQKGMLEKNHEFIRYFLPKKQSFNFLSQDKIDLMVSHINNTFRAELEDNSPYLLFEFIYKKNKAVLKELNIIYITPNDVILCDSIFKDGNDEIDK